MTGAGPVNARLSRQKARLRERLKLARQALRQQQRQEFDQAIHARLQPRLEQAGTVFCYVSTDVEVNTRDVIHRLRALDKTVLVPRIINMEKMIAVRFDGWEKLRAGQLGILTPENDDEWQSPIDLCITPGLGFTPDGKRIGYGKGYYDNWFAAHPHSATTALCYECQIVDDMPVTETDVRVDQIITEMRIIRCKGPGARD